MAWFRKFRSESTSPYPARACQFGASTAEAAMQQQLSRMWAGNIDNLIIQAVGTWRHDTVFIYCASSPSKGVPVMGHALVTQRRYGWRVRDLTGTNLTPVTSVLVTWQVALPGALLIYGRVAVPEARFIDIVVDTKQPLRTSVNASLFGIIVPRAQMMHSLAVSSSDY